MKLNEENGQKANEAKQVKSGTTAGGNVPAVGNTSLPKITDGENTPAWKVPYWELRLKEAMETKEMQEILASLVSVPDVVAVKKVRKPFTPEGAEISTQKIEGICGTTIEDASTIELTLVGMEELKKDAINKKYRIVDYTFALQANMAGGNFSGYAATGLKLMVTKLEEV